MTLKSLVSYTGPDDAFGHVLELGKQDCVIGLCMNDTLSKM